MIIEAFNELGYSLVVIGDGSELSSLQKRAKNNVQFFKRRTFIILLYLGMEVIHANEGTDIRKS